MPKATIEPYVLWRLSPGNVDFKTYGLRWVGKLPASFDYNIESAMQRGSLGAQDLRAWAGHALLGYTISGVSWQPRLIGEYNYASGNQDPRGRVDEPH